MDKIVIFGATGSVGAYLCLYLRKLGYEVIAVGGRKSDNGFFSKYGISYFCVDIRNQKDFDGLPLNGIFAVINLAGILPARMEGYYPQKYIDINITGALNVLLYCEKAKVEKVIYSQSISDVARLCGTSSPISSDAPTSFPLNNDHSVYSITKNAAVSLLEHYAAKCGYNYYILRFPNIYLYHPNPYYFYNGEQRWQGYRLMIHMALHNKPIQIWGDPHKVRDIVYVKDCCQIIERCIAVKNAESGTYNVGTGVGTTMEEQVRGIVETFSTKSIDSMVLYAPNMPSSNEYIFDITKTKNNLGYIPKYQYLDYLRDFKEEMLEQRFKSLWGDDLIEHF